MINNLIDVIDVTNDFLMYLNGKIDLSKDGFPVFTQNMFLNEEPELMVPYYNRHSKIVNDTKKTAICFFGSDESLYRRIENVYEDLDEYRLYQGVIGLDITVTADMDPEWQDAIMLLNQLFLAVLAVNDVKIIMNARTGSSSSIRNLMGLPKNILWATSFLGCNKLNAETDFSFISKILGLLPSKLLIYGKHDKIAENQLTVMGIPYRTYTDFHRLSKEVA